MWIRFRERPSARLPRLNRLLAPGLQLERNSTRPSVRERTDGRVELTYTGSGGGGLKNRDEMTFASGCFRSAAACRVSQPATAADPDLIERELWWCKFGKRRREPAVERVTAKAADHYRDRVLAHIDLLNELIDCGRTVGSPALRR